MCDAQESALARISAAFRRAPLCPGLVMAIAPTSVRVPLGSPRCFAGTRILGAWWQNLICVRHGRGHSQHRRLWGLRQTREKGRQITVLVFMPLSSPCPQGRVTLARDIHLFGAEGFYPFWWGTTGSTLLK